MLFSISNLSFFDINKIPTTEYHKVAKELEKYLTHLKLQEQFLNSEKRRLREETGRATKEIKRIQSVPLLVGQFMELIDDKHAIVQGMGGINFYVRVLSTIDEELLKPSVSVALHRHSQSIVDLLPENIDISVRNYYVTEKPDVTFSNIGGLDVQKQEIREAVELPLTCPELYEQIGIDAPTGVLLYGPPGTGKTMLARAIANATKASFFTMVGSEFVQKYLGEGPRMVRDVFKMAKERGPSIIFIDEVDAIATKRYDAQTGADREVQRILMELLNQLDGFDKMSNVKVIMATNRIDILDPALLRPGRLDRKIEFPMPDRRQRRLIFQSCVANMSLSPEVNLQEFVNRPGKVSAADIAAVCLEAGIQAVRNNRYIVLQSDFEKGWDIHIKNKDEVMNFYSF